MKHGLIPAAYTPFHPDYSLNTDVIAQLVQLYIAQGCKTVFINGTTGEFASMSLNERIVVAESWIKHKDTLSVWIHVGHTSQHEAIQLARHAHAIGAEAVSALAPYYFTPSSALGLVDFLLPIAKAAAPLPFYYYHIPSMTHSSIDMGEFIPIAVEQIPTFAGLKFSSPDLYTLQRARQAAQLESGSSIEILFGVDEMLLGALPFAIDGAIGSTYNFSSPLYNRLLMEYEHNKIDEAQKLQAQSAEIVREFHAYGGVSTGKAIMKMLGVSCGPPRPPLPTLSLAERNSVYEKIAPLEIFPAPLQPPASNL
ncbi:MAG: dihydrodipicolinate synthase family protein [Rhodothermaceae bacterium]|nr:dihydrodipicolinate synthase family protein [Rhodothermaceae bacterium]